MQRPSAWASRSPTLNFRQCAKPQFAHPTGSRCLQTAYRAPLKLRIGGVTVGMSSRSSVLSAVRFHGFPDERELVFIAMDTPYTRLTEADYDTKLREMGNYLWELEQELLMADSRQDEATAEQAYQKISSLAATADRYFEIPGGHQELAAYVSGLALRMTGQWADASDRFLNVLKLSPINGEAWLELSWCLAETEHWEECEMAARRGTELFPDTGAVWGNLALALDKLGRTSEAFTAVQNAVRLDPQDERSQELLARLEAKERA
jgi:tetratricopeptide (TPR) repeat protein